MATAEAGISLPRPLEFGASADLPRAVDPLLSLEAFSSAPAHTSRGPLHSGSTWVGVQRSGRNSYEVTVKFDEVDIDASKVCGTLEIKGLTPELDSLVTFFEGEIVGEVGSPGFRTGRFGATEFDDLKHWRRFPAFTRNRLERGLIKPELNLRASKNKPYVFLRLKEKHVVNHRVEAIHGASYAGFYYCCLDCEPSIVPLDSQSAPLHRGISPPSRTLMPTRARRASSASARGRPEPSLLAQTRPIAPRAPSTTRLSPPQVVVNLPAASNAQVTPPLVAPAPSRPVQPRRTSSGSISYAAAVRGEATSTSPTLPELSSSPTASTSSGSPATPPSIPPVIQVSEPSRPGSTDLPTPKVEFPEPAFSIFAPLDTTAPSLPPIWQAVAAGPFSPSYNAAHFGQPAGPSTSPTDEEWPVPVQTSAQVTPPPRPPAALRRMSSDVASVLAKAHGAFGERGRSGRVGARTSAFPYSAVDEDLHGDENDGQDGFDDRGLRSWTEATISGFYFHHSASPYQELSLRYVPSYRGGTAEYSFR